jgi:glycosyltransferase involved in cell wall biosynthesis
MRICIIPSAKLSYESGSTIYADTLSRHLAQRGHEVHVLCSELPPSSSPDVIFHILPILEHPVIDDYEVSSQSMVQTLHCISEKLSQLCEENRFDAIHAHYATLNGLAALSVGYCIYNVPVVVSCFGRDLFNGSDRDARYARMSTLVLKSAAFVVCSNEAIRAEVKKRAPFCRTTVLRTPVDISIFDESVSGLRIRQGYRGESWSPLLVCVCSCLATEKGVDTVVRAVASLKYEFSNIQLIVVGSDDHPQKANVLALEKLAKSLQADQHIIFAGGVLHDLIPQYMQVADFVIDARTVGSYSSAVLEALALGKVVIASDAAGNIEFIENDQNGITFARGDSAALANAIREVANDRALRARLERQAKEWFALNESQYTMNAHALELVRIFAECQQIAQLRL